MASGVATLHTDYIRFLLYLDNWLEEEHEAGSEAGRKDQACGRACMLEGFQSFSFISPIIVIP